MTTYNGKMVTLIGGSGFLGTQTVQQLVRLGYRVRVAVRRPDLAGHLKPLGPVSQILPVQANIRNRASLERAIEDADIVVNLAGITYEKGKQKFEAVNVTGAQTVAQICKKQGIKTLVHVSSLRANAQSESAYARSKAQGEKAVTKAFPNAIIMRPASIFGVEDRFFNMFAGLARVSPVLPLIHGDASYQPVYVVDIAKAIAKAVDGKAQAGKIYELGGADVETFKQLLQRMSRETQRAPILIPIPAGLAKFKAAFLQILPHPIITVDQVKMMERDCVVSDEATKAKRTLEGLGIAPTTMDAILPTYLWRFRKNGQYDANTVPAE